MTEKVLCPVCERPMKPKHTKGTDFMPFHHNTEGARCGGTGVVVNAKPLCKDCGTDYCPKLSDPAPTVEEPCEHPNGFTEHGCPCGAPRPDDRDEQGDDVNDTDQAKLDDAFGEPFGDPDKGPWFGAVYEGRCSVSECRIEEGDRIRADGQGGYECEDCGWDDPRLPVAAMYPEPTEEAVADAMPMVEGPQTRADWKNDQHMIHYSGGVADLGKVPEPPMGPKYYKGPMPTPDDFLFEDPTEHKDPEPVMSVSGQPKKVLRDHLGRYCVVLPGESELELFKSSGNPVGRTRVTTFIKHASSSKAINDWGKRNVVIGAARRRDLLLKAQGLTHESDRDRLNAIVRELEEAAGSKVGSDLGTYLHEFTEYMDAGLKAPDQAPEEFQGSLWLYEQALLDAGLEPITSLIERTTIIREYGWVCGTFDRIFFHRPSGQYIVGDLKTGQTMDYGKNEIEAQLWCYAHGVNQNGVYDWNTRTWSPAVNDGSDWVDYPVKVSETVGVVIHMPVQGPKEGTVSLLWADLVNGAAHAATCAEVRARPGGKMRAWGDGPTPVAPKPRALTSWEIRFGSVDSGEAASALWREAKAAGIEGAELARLVELARKALADRG